MKWITITKAKPVFDQPYLLSIPTENPPIVGYLDSSINLKSGVEHTFVSDSGVPAKGVTHIAKIVLPGQKDDE